MSKTLIVFYSRAGENYFGGAMRHIAVGNTKVAAGMLQEITGGDLFEIEQVEPYSNSYMTCIEEAKRDLETDARPAVRTYPDSLDDYDTIYLCYPNYWGTMPMAVWTFLEHFDFTGKTIYPLCTNEGSGMGRSEADIQKLCPGAVLGKGLAVTGSHVQKVRPSLKHWVEQSQ